MHCYTNLMVFMGRGFTSGGQEFMLVSSPDPTLSRGDRETFLAGRRARAGHETKFMRLIVWSYSQPKVLGFRNESKSGATTCTDAPWSDCGCVRLTALPFASSSLLSMAKTTKKATSSTNPCKLYYLFWRRTVEVDYFPRPSRVHT